MSILHGSHRADSVNEWLEKRYGLNPYGQPLFRLVVAEEVYQMNGGTHYDWPEGSKVEERGAVNVGQEFVDDWRDPYSLPVVASTLMPVRVVTEMREVQKYPEMEGWILERWFPAWMYGSEEGWLSFKDEEGNPRLGPYPEKGEYEIVSPDAAKTTPTTGQVEATIDAWLQDRNARTVGNAVSRMRQRIVQAMEREEREEAKFKETLVAKMADATSPLWGSSLGAGRLREQYAKKAGVKEHVGN